MPSTRALGGQIEQWAAKYLTQRGYLILEHNYHTQFGEIDLIARQNNQIVFVEVKARSSARFGQPTEAVTPRKLQKIIKAGQHYLKQHSLSHLPARIDVLAVWLNTKDKSPQKAVLLTNVTG